MDREIPKEERLKVQRRKWIIFGGAVVCATCMVMVVTALLKSSVNRKDVVISTVDRGMIEASVNASGKVVPAFEEVINSPISTRIVEVYCKAGDSVDIGTPLLLLDLQSAETELSGLEDQMRMKHYELDQQRINNETFLSDLAMRIEVKAMSVNRLEVEVANERYLDSLGSGTGDRVRQAELAYRTGKLELEQLRQQLDNERQVRDASMKVKELDISVFDKNLSEKRRTLQDAKILSPRKATLTYINNQIGQKINAGEQIATISDLSHFKVDGEIADAYGDRISVGGRAIVRIGKERLDGTVSNVTPLSKNGVIAFSVTLADDHHRRLRSGLKTDVYVMHDVIEDVVRLANGSYYTGPGDYELFVVTSDDELTRRHVRLGDSNFDYVEVRSGLNPGDRVITSDMKQYRDRNTLKLK
ncbi:MAG: efflux RND transporter periplasmic adaptor subunit [Muribaculum sp.]|nr:efflux RND transporter periplasmic adaptor subunit [Muribaculum sp.]